MIIEKFSFFNAIRWKYLMPFLIFLMIIVTAQYYILVINDSTASFVKEKLSLLSQVGNQRIFHKHNLSLPLHILLLSYARTGSSFVGDLLQSYPKSFYHFEPLHFLSGPVMNDSFKDARQLLYQLFRCKVSKVPGFLSWQRSHLNYMKLKRSIRYWTKCNKMGSCYNATFIDAYCSNQTVTVIKTIRLSLREAQKLFTEYPDLNLKIVYLSRDPRGTLNSRLKFPVSMWCKKDRRCVDSQKYCLSIEDDFNVSCSLLTSRPDSFTIVRYEDLARSPYTESKQLLHFLGLSESLPKEVVSFLKGHISSTKPTFRDGTAIEGLEFPYSTFRNSVLTSVKWRYEMPLFRVKKIQRDCRTVLQKFGYHEYETSGMLRSDINMDEDLKDSIAKACST